MDRHDKSEILRLLPSVDALLQTATAAKILRQSGAKHLTALARAATDALRQEIAGERNDGKNY